MPSANKTPNYNLTQYSNNGSDKISALKDYNEDMSKIDTAINQNANNIAAKADKATTYSKTDVDSKLTTKADVSTTYSMTDIDTKLMKLTQYNVIAHGADSTGEQDSSENIINWIKNDQPEYVYFPAGTYLFNSGLNLTYPSFKGIVGTNAVIKANKEMDFLVDASYFYRTIFQGLVLDCNKLAHNGAKTSDGVVFCNNVIKNFDGIGLKMRSGMVSGCLIAATPCLANTIGIQETNDSEVSNTRVFQCAIGFDLTGNGGGETNFSNVYIWGDKLNPNVTRGIYQHKGGYFFASALRIDATDNGIMCEEDSSISITNMTYQVNIKEKATNFIIFNFDSNVHFVINGFVLDSQDPLNDSTLTILKPNHYAHDCRATNIMQRPYYPPDVYASPNDQIFSRLLSRDYNSNFNAWTQLPPNVNTLMEVFEYRKWDDNTNVSLILQDYDNPMLYVSIDDKHSIFVKNLTRDSIPTDSFKIGTKTSGDIVKVYIWSTVNHSTQYNVNIKFVSMSHSIISITMPDEWRIENTLKPADLDFTANIGS
jgi:hypothetical protein